jgi:AraC-like DNA-binding protein
MAYREILPHPALRPYVDRFWVQAADVASPLQRQFEPQRILPDGCIDVLVSLRRRTCHVVGTMTRALVVSQPAAATAAVRFRPGGAVAFLGVAAHELTDRYVPAEEVGLPWWSPRVLEAEHPAAAVRELERSLLLWLSSLQRPHPIAAAAVQACFGQAPLRVEQLARDLGYSRQRLTRLLLDQVGIGAKDLLRVGRLQRAVDQLQRAKGRSLAQAAVGLGYFDQAHLCRDFRELVGLSPSVVRASAGSIFPIRSLLTGA